MVYRNFYLAILLPIHSLCHKCTLGMFQYFKLSSQNSICCSYTKSYVTSFDTRTCSGTYSVFLYHIHFTHYSRFLSLIILLSLSLYHNNLYLVAEYFETCVKSLFFNMFTLLLISFHILRPILCAFENRVFENSYSQNIFWE